MTNANPGEPERVPVRKVWPLEANFTNWLAANMDALSREVGIQLELVQEETPIPGNMRVDVLAKVSETDEYVVIENQMEESDNDHFAGLLNYASHSDARILILVAGGITDWHRRTMDWLNDADGIWIYGVEMSAWRNGSQVELRLDLVAGPNKRMEWSGYQYPADKQKYLDFFRPLVAELLEQGITQRNVAKPSNDQEFPGGFDGITYHCGFWGGSDPWFSIYLWIATQSQEFNKAILDAIHKWHKPSIECELAEVWWDRRDKQRMSAIGISIPGSIEDSDERLSEIRGWAAENILKFKSVIQPCLDQVMLELQPNALEESL